jgi:Ricin-type beta-trefoil lectin domain
LTRIWNNLLIDLEPFISIYCIQLFMSVLNFQVVKNLVNITLSIALVASLTPSLFANAQVTVGTTQLNQINFDPAISLSEVREYLKNNQFRNLKSASIVTDLETKDFVLPVNLDLNLEDDNNDSKTITSYQSTKKAIIDGIRQAKKDINKPKQKFDSKKLLESFQVSSSSTLPAGAKIADEIANFPKPPSPTLPTEEELKYYEDNGVLPPIKVDPIQIKKLIKDSGLPENYLVPHLDPIQKGKFSNSRPEDVYNSMTPVERTANQKRVDEAKLQEELVNKTTEEELKNIELDNTTNKTPELKISQLNYYTEVGDSNAKDTAIKAQKPNSKEAKEENKPKLQRNDDARKNKQNSQDQKTRKNSKKIEDKIKDTVSQDITSLFKVSDEETAKTKAETEKQKQNWLNNTKTNRQQLNEYEAEGYVKEGLDLTTLNVDVIDATTNKPKTKAQVQDLVNKEKKTSSLGDLLKFGSIKAEARGLNDGKFSLMIYSPVNDYFAMGFDTQNLGQPAYYRYATGEYGKQRFCFDNQNNRIELTFNNNCTQPRTNRCLDIYGANFQNGTTIGLWECHSGTSEKWIMDERGRISSKDQPDMCIDGYGGNIANGTPLKLWGCHTGGNQMFRAGYNNFGQNMGMTMWATQTGNFSYNVVGHAFVEFWNNYGTHNSFSRWDPSNFDTDCGWYDITPNNMCENDAITVDKEFDRNYDPKYSSFRKYAATVPKQMWDYIVFGSGFRSNFRYEGAQINLGGLGTYSGGNVSQSRNTYYNAQYGIAWNMFDLDNVCSGYAMKLWNAARTRNDIYYFDGTAYGPTVIWNIIRNL